MPRWTLVQEESSVAFTHSIAIRKILRKASPRFSDPKGRNKRILSKFAILEKSSQRNKPFALTKTIARRWGSMNKKRKRRLMKVDNRILLPLSEEFIADNHLAEDTILQVDEELLAKAIKPLTKEDILQEVLDKIMDEGATREEEHGDDHY